MSNNGDLKIEVKKAGDGTAMATINGKIYNLLALYEDWRAGGPFFLIAAGRTPLKADDLAEHWGVIHRGPLSIAFAQRPFSYHLLQGEDSEPPTGCDWPRLKAPPEWYAFAGPSQAAVEAQLRLVIEQYAPSTDLERALERAEHVHDAAGLAPDALLVRL
jgi:hypothetical protein